jgi:hypothetical protein
MVIAINDNVSKLFEYWRSSNHKCCQSVSIGLSCILISIIDISLVDMTSFPLYTMTLCILLLESKTNTM